MVHFILIFGIMFTASKNATLLLLQACEMNSVSWQIEAMHFFK